MTAPVWVIFDQDDWHTVVYCPAEGLAETHYAGGHDNGWTEAADAVALRHGEVTLRVEMGSDILIHIPPNATRADVLSYAHGFK
jgi:hypothetical protein